MQLTDEDLARIGTLIGALIAESETRITKRFEGRLDAAEARIASRFADIETRITNRFEGRLDAVEARINEKIAHAIEAAETKLLTAFHEWASPTDQKIRSHREALRALDLQIEEIGSRVKKLEADSETRH